MSRRITKEQAECIALKYLNGVIKSKSEFANKNKLLDSDLRLLRKVLREENSDLYEKYINGERFNINYGSKKDELDIILDGIINGIDGREFDLLDYYLITDCNFSTLINVFNDSGYSNDLRKKLIGFFSKNSRCVPNIYGYNDYNNPYILNEVMEMRIKQIISGHEVTDEEKVEAINYMKDNNLPMYKKLYTIKLKRIANEKEREKSIVKQKKLGYNK